MNQDTLMGNWTQIKGQVREKWGKLTENDLEVIAGRRDQLLGRLQERYGLAKDAAEKQIAEFEKRITASNAATAAGAHR